MIEFTGVINCVIIFARFCTHGSFLLFGTFANIFGIAYLWTNMNIFMPLSIGLGCDVNIVLTPCQFAVLKYE